MKKKVFVLLIMLAVLSFAACEKETENKIENENQDSNKNSVTEQRFQLSSDGYDLNAVYVDAGNAGPAVLLIAGSGPCDEDETVGSLKPFSDIANAFAKQGISSLRFEKRTFQYAEDFLPTDGIEEEYLTDCRAALAWLREQPKTESVYLLGHSLGGQMATILAAEDKGIKGIILWNSTARHLADVCYDQFTAADPDNQSSYAEYAAAAKAAGPNNAKGYFYYGASDYYWASYNEIQVIDNINKAGILTLIINSTYDNQIFDADIELWEKSFENTSNVTRKIYDDQSHFGYQIDTNDAASLYSKQEFPEELISDFASFCK